MVAAWLVVAAAFAIGDWVAVATKRKPLEYVCKPATMAALIGVAIALDPRNSAMRWWFIAALVFSLLGDVFLMLPSDQFVFGLASFLVGHVAYTVGFNLDGASRADLLFAAIVTGTAAVIVARPILKAVWAGDDPSLRVPVVVYMVAIAAMVTSAVATGGYFALVGAWLFFASDATIAWNRFVKADPRAPTIIIVTYHLAQAGLVLSLAR